MNAHGNTDPSNPPATHALSVPELLDRCMGNPDIATLLLDKFEAQARRDIEEIARQLTARDAVQIASTAHALKGAAGAVAAPLVRDAAAAVESNARQARLDILAQEFVRLRAEVERCLTSLPEARRSLRSTDPRAPGGTR